MTDELGFTCCFCNEKIKTNACEVAITNNLDKDVKEQNSQFFWTHVECFGKHLHQKIKMHYFLPSLMD